MAKNRSETFYRQCRYEQAFPLEGEGTKIGVSWIPESLAKMGRHIYFGEKLDDVPRELLYKVTMVGDNRRDGSWLRKKQNADKKQRQASDI